MIGSARYPLHRNILCWFHSVFNFVPRDQIVTAKKTIPNMTVADEPIPLSRDKNDVHFLDSKVIEGAEVTLPDAEDETSQ